MARVTSYTCDRCGKEITNREGSLPVITLKNEEGDALLHHAGIVDVCGKCLDIAANYIRRAYKMPVEKGDEKVGVDEGEEAA
jgi:hypothetical protein